MTALVCLVNPPKNCFLWFLVLEALHLPLRYCTDVMVLISNPKTHWVKTGGSQCPG